METKIGKIVYINGPVVRVTGAENLKMREMVLVGEKQLIGEVISVDKDTATIQVYEETTGLMRGEGIISKGRPLSVKLGPGIIKNIFDGISERTEKKVVRLRIELGRNRNGIEYGILDIKVYRNVEK